MPRAAVVPAPASLEVVESAPFALHAGVRIEGETDAAAVLAALIRVRTGLAIEPAAG